jgi:hypothetical protein
MKKALITSTLVIALIAILSVSCANASLTMNVQVGKSTITPFEPQQIVASANERGAGILIVIQPANGQPWTDFLNSHPALKAAYNVLPSNIKTQITNEIGNSVVSYAIVDDLWVLHGGQQSFTFPDDFEGVNGQPSTGLAGTYKVLFAYASVEGSLCDLFEANFACGLWQVIPEVPLGTAVASVSLIAGAATFAFYKKRHPATL